MKVPAVQARKNTVNGPGRRYSSVRSTHTETALGIQEMSYTFGSGIKMSVWAVWWLWLDDCEERQRAEMAGVNCWSQRTASTRSGELRFSFKHYERIIWMNALLPEKNLFMELIYMYSKTLGRNLSGCCFQPLLDICSPSLVASGFPLQVINMASDPACLGPLLLPPVTSAFASISWPSWMYSENPRHPCCVQVRSLTSLIQLHPSFYWTCAHVSLQIL